MTALEEDRIVARVLRELKCNGNPSEIKDIVRRLNAMETLGETIECENGMVYRVTFLQDAAVTLSTEEFWAKMCQVDFTRTTRHTGRCGATVYYTETPPEDDPDFLDSVQRGASTLLRFSIAGD